MPDLKVSPPAGVFHPDRQFFGAQPVWDVNRAVTHVAREAAEPRRQPLDEETPSPAPTPHDALEALDLQDRLTVAVRALPLALRQPALLTLEGFSPAEIAPMLGLNANTVSIRLTRAKAALRQALNPEDQP